MLKQLYSLLCLALLLLSTAQADSLTVIQLHNRPAEEIMPIVKPMLAAGEVLTGQGFKLFLRASSETLEQVEAMIDVLDAAAKMLQISVTQGSSQDLEALRIDANLKIEGGNSSVDIGSRSDNSAGNINYNSGNVSGGVDASATRVRRHNKPVHRLRVSEGREGYIETGEQIPYLTGVSRIMPGTTVGSSEYKNVTTGFYVLARIHGDSVTLQISPFKNSLSNTNAGSINTQSANTVISGRIGEWLEIGGVSEESSGSQSGIGSYGSSQGRKTDHIWIGADLVK
jgi:type II secretory pathway component GspD/PulD (secretin)